MQSGCTAVVAIINPQEQLFIANAGESRAVLIEDGKPLAMSVDHKPSRDSEMKRIVRAGGEVRPTTVTQCGCLL